MELDARIADGLPFEPKQQDALLGHIFKNPAFFAQVKDRIKGNWFLDGWTGKLYDSYAKFYHKFGHLPASDDEFLAYEEIMVLGALERTKVKNALIKARSETANFSLDVLREGLTGWLQSRIYHQYVSQSTTLFNNRKFSEAKSLMATMVRELQNISFDGVPPMDYSDHRALIRQIQVDSSNALTLGHPVLDKALNPDCEKGSLLMGDSTTILAPTNQGKTTHLVTVIAANLLDNQPVLFIHHEGRAVDIMQKLWICLMDVTKKQFDTIGMDPAYDQTFKMLSDLISRNLVHLDMQRPGLTVEEVISTVRSHQERLKNSRGHGFRLLVDDYPAILNTESSNNIRQERRQKDAYVYRYFVDYAGAEKMHNLNVIQTNREGSKINRKVGEHKNKRQLLTLEYVQEAYEVTNSATTLITLNRSPADALAERLTYLICKSRSGETNVAVTCRSNYRHGRTHWATYPATVFKGTDSIENLESLLLEYNGKEIPHDRMFDHGR